MLNIILLYLPSIVGLLLVNWQLYVLLRIARNQKSTAAPFVTAITLGMLGVLISWFIVVKIAIDLSNFGFPLLDYRIAFLPIGWALILYFINNNLRK